MISFNHEGYIEQAIRSVLMQETSFRCNVIVGDDGSTDGTAEIIRHLCDSFPGRITPILRTANVGSLTNFSDIVNRAIHASPYVALLEGDDYWTSTTKLQAQVDYLEANPTCRISFHPAQTRRGDEVALDRFSLSGIPPTVRLRDWLDRPFAIPTASVVFRSPGRSLPAWFSRLRYSGDWGLYAALGSVHPENSETLDILPASPPRSVWRSHDGGATHGFRASRGSPERRQVLLRSLADLEVLREESAALAPNAFAGVALERCLGLILNSLLSFAPLAAARYYSKACRYALASPHTRAKFRRFHGDLLASAARSLRRGR